MKATSTKGARPARNIEDVRVVDVVDPAGHGDLVSDIGDGTVQQIGEADRGRNPRGRGAADLNSPPKSGCNRCSTDDPFVQTMVSMGSTSTSRLRSM